MRLLAGLGVGVVSPYLIQFARAGLGHSIQGMLLDPVFELRGGRSLPVPPSWDHFDGFLQKAAGLRDIGWPLPTLAAAARRCSSGSSSCRCRRSSSRGTGGWRMRQAPGSCRARVLFAAGLFGARHPARRRCSGPTPPTSRGSAASRSPLLPVASASCAARRAAVAARAGRSRRSRSAALLLVGVIPLFPSAHLRRPQRASRSAATCSATPINNDGRNFYYGNAEVPRPRRQRGRRARRARRGPGKRLFVGPADLRKTPYSDAFFYYLFPELTPGTHYIEMDPGMANAPDSGLADEVRHAGLADPVRRLDRLGRAERLAGSSVPTTPNEVVREDFCLVGDYGAGRAYRALLPPLPTVPLTRARRPAGCHGACDRCRPVR